MKRVVAYPLAWNLDALASLYGTDKGRSGYGYTTAYAHHLGRQRYAVKSVLEIGVGGYDRLELGGESLRMWRSYFPRATVYGLDISPKRLPAEPRIVVRQGDQSDQGFLAELAASYGPFDLVVDDGCHLGRHQRASFFALFPAVRPGGLYVIEDLLTAYWEDWGGGPPGTPGTGVELVKESPRLRQHRTAYRGKCPRLSEYCIHREGCRGGDTATAGGLPLSDNGSGT